MGVWWQNLRLVPNSTLFCLMFDMYVDPGSALIFKFKFSIGFGNVGKFGVKSPWLWLDKNGVVSGRIACISSKNLRSETI